MKKILVVDDSPTMRRMVISSLRDLSPVQFEQAGSGLEAIEKLALFRFDLIILDLNMPDMHGMEVLQFIRRHSMYREIPVAILTTKDDEATRTAALEAGATFFTTKPYNPSDFAVNMKRLLKIDYVRYE
ncbi:MAG TPA: response regulator [Bacteroidales bacterium]|nr:response regulator [Bacteroidales bacterium]